MNSASERTLEAFLQCMNSASERWWQSVDCCINVLKTEQSQGSVFFYAEINLQQEYLYENINKSAIVPTVNGHEEQNKRPVEPKQFSRDNRSDR